jgi:peptidoglycan/LPS O-acetylase OafA/YrhL
MKPALHTHKAAIIPIQALRGMAACLVVIVHLLERLTKRGAFAQPLPDWVWSCGHIGVGVFFAISGFIMVYTTADEFGRPSAGKRFFLRRFLRVAPIYYLTSALMVAFAYVTFRYSTNAVYPVPTPPLALMSALFVPYMDYKGLTLPVYELGWTLNYEMFFYAAFALALMAPRRIGLVGVMTALLGLMLVGMLVPAPPPLAGTPVPLFFFTRPVMLYFVIGMALGASGSASVPCACLWPMLSYAS